MRVVFCSILYDLGYVCFSHKKVVVKPKWEQIKYFEILSNRRHINIYKMKIYDLLCFFVDLSKVELR